VHGGSQDARLKKLKKQDIANVTFLTLKIVVQSRSLPIRQQRVFNIPNVFPKIPKLGQNLSGNVFFCFHLHCLRDFVTHKGDRKTQSVSQRLSDNPGELKLMHKSPTESFSQSYVATMKELGVLILPPVGNVGSS